jgi:uncharacterized protein YozE (UPF0346 family)
MDTIVPWQQVQHFSMQYLFYLKNSHVKNRIVQIVLRDSTFPKQTIFFEKFQHFLKIM